MANNEQGTVESLLQFDALYSKRPYRDKLPLDRVIEIIMADATKGCLDPKITEILFSLLENGQLKSVIEED